MRGNREKSHAFSEIFQNKPGEEIDPYHLDAFSLSVLDKGSRVVQIEAIAQLRNLVVKCNLGENTQDWPEGSAEELKEW